MANQVYNNFKKLAFSGAINFFTGVVKMALVSGAYQFSHNHTVTGQITGQVVATNYVRGGNLVPSTTVLIDSVDNEAVLSGSSVTYTGLTCSLQYGILYLSGDTPASNYLIGQVDFGAQTLSNSDFTVNWNSEGILNLT